MIGFTGVLLPCVVQSATILFGEPSTEGGNSSFVAIDANGIALPACAAGALPPAGGCVDIASTMLVESTTAVLRFPLGALGGNNLSSTAYLLEPAFEIPGGLAISDRVNLAITSGTGNFDVLTAAFLSDNESGNQGSIPANFPVGLRIAENGALQEITGLFFTGTDTGPTPVGATLPGGTRIFAQSDIAPEPSSMLLALGGVLICVGHRSRKRK